MCCIFGFSQNFMFSDTTRMSGQWALNVLHCLRQTFSLTGCPVSIPAVPVPLPHPAAQVHIGIALHIHIGHFLTRFSRREGGRVVDKTVENKKFSSDRLSPYFLCKHDSVSLENLCRTLDKLTFILTHPSRHISEEKRQTFIWNSGCICAMQVL